MTEPTTPAVLAPPQPVVPPSPVLFPLGWLLSTAAPPIQYRAITEVAQLDPAPENVEALRFAFRPALALAATQSPDGVWSDSMLTLPTSKATFFEGVGTINAARRLLEYGWDKDTPPLLLARRILFRLLAEDQDPAYLFELAPRKGGGDDPDLIQWGRALLREAAAAVLAQSGYENDPRLRGAARRILMRVSEFIRSPLGDKPFVRVGNRHVLPAEAAPPSIYSLIMLAHMPLFRSEHSQSLDAIYEFISRPLPRQESVQMFGKSVLEQPHLILGDVLPHRNAADADVPFALLWLEIMARLNFLRRNEGWCRLLDRFLDDRDANGIWHPHKGSAVQRSSNPYVWASHPLDEGEGEERWTDVTFRLGLIARLAGRPIDIG